MKRSEAVTMLKNNLRKHFYPGTGYGADEAYTTKAEGILDFLETQIGMLPPSAKVGGRWSDDSGYANEWEDEDGE